MRVLAGRTQLLLASQIPYSNFLLLSVLFPRPTHALGAGHFSTSAVCGPALQNPGSTGRLARVAPTLLHDVPFGHSSHSPAASR
jgi:hypothetical protein